MRKINWVGFGVVVFVLLAVTSGILLSQRQHTVLLQSRMELARLGLVETERVREENRRLKENQISPTELEALRVDHEAVARLRTEVEALQRTAENKKQALAVVEPRFPQRMQPAASPPAASLTMMAGSGGKISLEGAPMDATWLKQRLSILPRGSSFEIRLQVPKMETPEEGAALKAGIDPAIKMVAEVAKELGLSMSVKTEMSSP